MSVPDREAGFFDGIDPTLAGLADHPTRLSDGLRDLLAEAAQRAWRTADEFRPAAPGRTGQQLLDIADMLRRVGESLGSEAVDEPVRRALRALLDHKLRAVEQVAAQCLGLSLECVAGRAHLTPSTRVGITVRLWSDGDQVVDAAEIALHAGEGWTVATDGDPPPYGDGRPLASRFEAHRRGRRRAVDAVLAARAPRPLAVRVGRGGSARVAARSARRLRDRGRERRHPPPAPHRPRCPSRGVPGRLPRAAARRAAADRARARAAPAHPPVGPRGAA